MKKHLIGFIMAVVIIISGQSGAVAAGMSCAEKDRACREFSTLAAADQFDKIIEKVDAKKDYSEAARSIIGQAYLMVAGRETNTPEQEEQF